MRRKRMWGEDVLSDDACKCEGSISPASGKYCTGNSREQPYGEERPRGERLGGGDIGDEEGEEGGEMDWIG